MIKQPVVGTAPPGLATPLFLPTQTPVPPPSAISKPVDPRAAARPPPPPTSVAQQPSDPRARLNPADPRSAAAGDPRGGGAGAAAPPPNFPPPPPMMGPPPGVGVMPPPMSMPPPPMMAGMQQQQQQQLPGMMGGVDANLAQAVMALTPAQIAQLPPDKQQNIFALRQQITGGILH